MSSTVTYQINDGKKAIKEGNKRKRKDDIREVKTDGKGKAVEKKMNKGKRKKSNNEEENKRKLKEDDIWAVKKDGNDK